MKNHDIVFASRPQNLTTRIMSYYSNDKAFSPYGDYWKQLLKIFISELLSPKRVLSYRSIREAEVSDFINWIASKAGSPVNLTNKTYSLIDSITSRAAFGKKCKDQELFISAARKAITWAAELHIADLFPSIELLHRFIGLKTRLEWMHQETDMILENIINEHKKSKSKVYADLLDVLLKVQEQGDLQFPFTTNSIKAVILVSNLTSCVISLFSLESSVN